VRNVLTLLVAAVVALGILAYSQQQSIDQLTAQVQRASRTTALELKAQCAKQAKVFFDANAWNPYQHANFTDHYDPASNKCFILISVLDDSQAGHVSQNLMLSDAFEGTDFGDFLLWADKAGDSWKNETELCYINVPSGGMKLCHSQEEFDKLVRTYMGWNLQ
jgi:hypothetical protein